MACKCSGKDCTCKKNPLNEHIGRIMEKTAYVLGEAKYNLADQFQDDDGIPKEIWSSNAIEEADEEIPQETPTEEEPVAELPASEPEDQLSEPMPELGAEPPVDQLPAEEESDQTVDEIQNDIIKTNIAAMEKMNNRVNDLGMALDSINQKLEVMNSDVEEVKEPTNVEKLMSKKADSHPFYYNLNDMWNGNSFQARMQEKNMHGIRKLDDGTYIADFDSLPKYSDQEIDKSFNE